MHTCHFPAARGRSAAFAENLISRQQHTGTPDGWKSITQTKTVAIIHHDALQIESTSTHNALDKIS
jgi:hypothetical protein